MYFISLANVVIYSRLKGNIEKLLGDDQYEFCKSKSTIDRIFNLRQILEKHYEFKKNYIILLNFKQAYESVIRKELWNSLRRFAIPQKNINLLRVCNKKTVCKMRITKEITQPFKVT